MKSHEVDYKILGNDMQVVEIALDPGEAVIAEAGMMNYLEDGIQFETRMGDGADADEGIMGKLWSVGKRMVTGESMFMTHFENHDSKCRHVAFSAPFPGTIIPVDLSSIGGRLICQKDSFLAAARGTKLGIAFSKRIGAGLFGGEGFILQSLEGDGMAFVQAGGTIVEKQLNNETIRLDTGCLVAFTEGLDYDIELVKGLKSMLFGGEGLVLATLKGSGTVWIQSLPFSRLADRILANAPAAGGKDQGE